MPAPKDLPVSIPLSLLERVVGRLRFDDQYELARELADHGLKALRDYEEPAGGWVLGQLSEAG